MDSVAGSEVGAVVGASVVGACVVVSSLVSVSLDFVLVVRFLTYEYVPSV